MSEVKLLSCVRLFATPWTVAYHAPLFVGFSRQECWSGLPFPSPGDLPDPGIEPGSPALQADPYHLSIDIPIFLRGKKKKAYITLTIKMSHTLHNKYDRCAVVHGVTKSLTQLGN